MRIRAIIAVSAVLAALGAGPVAAGSTDGSSGSGGPLARLSFAASDIFAPDYQMDGTVYGVRARGRGHLEILHGLSPASNSTTPGACSNAAGWCDTAHGIAVSAFGWDYSEKGAGAVVGIVDSGIDLNHPEFKGRVLRGGCITSSVNPCTKSWDKRGGDTTNFPGADYTHGTHVAGIAAGANVGIASKADILPVKVCSSTVDSCVGVTDGIVYAAKHGADIINVSIGGPILSNSDIAGFRTAIGDGALLVVAAGNEGTRDPTNGYLAGAALKNGVRGSMIVVGATGSGGTDGYGKIASFSNTASNRCEIHGGHRYCMKNYFVVAPGYNIWSSVGNGGKSAGRYDYLSGTSMATPYVTGVAAVIKGRWPTLTASQIADIIFQTADDVGAPGIDRIYGRGAVDITKALSPVGAAVVATSGTVAQAASSTHAASVSHVSGASGAMTALATGPLAVAVRNSKLLKKAVVVDSFGRDFSADLTHATYNPGFANFDTMAISDAFETVTPIAGGMMTAFGPVTASGYAVTTTTPHLLSGEYLATDRKRHDLRDFELNATVAPGVTVEAGYNLEMAGRFNPYDASASRAYDGLFFSASAVNSPYVSLTDGGNFLGTSVQLSDDVSMHFGASSLDPQRPEFEVPVYAMAAQVLGRAPYFDQRQAQSAEAGLTWDFAKWGGLGVTASSTTEENGLLGGADSGALSVAKSAQTSAVGVSARVGFGKGWVTTFSYNEGITQLSLRPNGLVTGADSLHSRSYGVAVAKHGLFSNSDLLGVALTRPIQIYAGGVNFTAGTGVDDNGNLIVGHEHVSLASSTPETDVELGYVTTFFDGALALQANAGYQMNFAGQSGTNALTVLSRAKINF